MSYTNTSIRPDSLNSLKETQTVFVDTVTKHRKNIRKLFCLIWLLFLANLTQAQKINFRFAFGNRAATIYPFTHAFDKTFYPVFQSGIEYKYFDKKRCSLYQTAILHYNYHKYLGHDFGIISEFAVAYHFKKSFFIQTSLGIGYLAEAPTTKTYKLNSNGDYVRTTPILSMVTIPFSLMGGYEFKKGVAVFLAYQYGVQFPYNRTVPLLPTDNVMLGIKYKIIKKKKNEEK